MKRVLMVLLVVLTCAAPMAQAANCSAVVVDEAGLIKNTGAIETAARNLLEKGAEARVRTFKTLSGFSTLDELLKNRLLRECPSWANVRGTDLKGNMVVMLLSIEGKRKGFYAGGDLRFLEPSVVYIRETVMRSRFALEDFAGGFAAGLNETATLIELHTREAHAPPVATAQSAPQPQQIVVHEQPTDLSGLVSVMKWGMFIAFLLGLVVIAFRITGERARRRAAQQGAQSKKYAAAQLIIGLQDIQMTVASRFSALAQKVDESEVAPVREALTNASRLADRAITAYSELGNSVNDPDRPGQSVEEYLLIEQVFENIYQSLDRTRATLTDIDKAVGEVENFIAEAPAAIQQAQADCVDAEKRVAAVVAQGYRVEVELGGLAALITESFGALESRKYHDATRTAKLASAAAKAAADAAEGLIRKRDLLETGIESLGTDIHEAQEAVTDAKKTFDRISEEHAEVAWSCVKGNGTEATKRVNGAIVSMAEAMNAISMIVQDWKGATNALLVGDGQVADAFTLTHSITEIARSLDEAKGRALRDIDAAQEDVFASHTFNKEVDGDVDDGVWQKLEQASNLLGKARAELNEGRPDYFEAIKLAKQAHDLADQTLTQARDEHDAFERLRQKATNALSAARSRHSKAREFIQDHDGDVSVGAKSLLDDAYEELTSAVDARSIERQIALAQQAESMAKSAFQKAKENFEEAEIGRAPISTRRDNTSVIVTGPNWGSPHVASVPAWSPNPAPTYDAGPSVGGDSVGFSSPDPGPSVGGESRGW